MPSTKELKKDWFMDLTVSSKPKRNPVPLTLQGLKVKKISRKWKAITRTEFLSFALVVCKRSLKRSRIKHPYILEFWAYCRTTKNGYLTTTIRIKNSFRDSKNLRGIMDPLQCFVVGASLRADKLSKE